MHTFLSGALRRLLVVIGCIVLATMQPMRVFAESAVEPVRSPDTVIYPKTAAAKPGEGSPAGTASPAPAGYSSTPVLVVAILLAGAGVWVLWRKRAGDLRFGGLPGKKLAIEETKSLGNRQYLVVASYEGRKYLLGVTTDRIELLTHLPGAEDAE